MQSFIEADMHCHTIASTHAFSTIWEMVQFAPSAGLKAFAVTDHGPASPDSPHLWHFDGLFSLPEQIDGIRVFRGAEANIIDFSGNIDFSPDYQQRFDWIVASFHEDVCPHGTRRQHTDAYLELAGNPYVRVIGHSAGDDYPYDYERVLPVFREKGKLVELNNKQAGFPNYRRLAEACKKHRVPVVVDSDAHSCFALGNVQAAFSMLREIGFPDDLIVNRSMASLSSYMEQWKQA